MNTFFRHPLASFRSPAVFLVLVFMLGSSPTQAQKTTPTTDPTAVPAAVTTPPVTPSVSSASTGPVPLKTPKPDISKPVVIPYDQQPYRVSLSLGIDPTLGMTPDESNRLVAQLRDQLLARVGAAWNAQVTLAEPRDPTSHDTLTLRSAKDWTAAIGSTPIDKKLALTLDRVGTKYRLAGIEWDRTTEQITPIMTREAFDRRRLSVLAADLAMALFRPLVSVTAVTENAVELKIRGGDFLPADATATPFQVGDHLTTYIRHYDKKHELRRIQEIPWSYLRVDLVDRGFIRATQITPFKSPLASSKRRAESFAMKVNPYFPSSTVTIIPRGKPDAPLAGYRVELLNREETKTDLVADRLKIRTNRAGQVALPVDAAHRLQTLIVYSGASPLARVPIIPGHAPTLQLNVPDDTPRMNVEAETELLQSELVDTVARRHVMMARARAAAQKGNFEQVTEFQKQINELPTLEQFQKRIENLRLPGVQAARSKKDKAQESRITKLCDKINKQATEHLDSTTLTEFEAEMSELKKAQ